MIENIISRACETLGVQKVLAWSANIVPFLVARVAYLISASWLARVGHDTERVGGHNIPLYEGN